MADSAISPEAPWYRGDEEFLYYRADRFIEDMLEFSPRWTDLQGLELFLRRRLNEVLASGQSLDFPALLKEMDQFTTYPQQERRYIPQRIRREVMKRDGGRCVVCGSTDGVSLDHIRPFSRGGKHTKANLRVLCKSCNSSKGATPEEVWRARKGD